MLHAVRMRNMHACQALLGTGAMVILGVLRNAGVFAHRTSARSSSCLVQAGCQIGAPQLGRD